MTKPKKPLYTGDPNTPLTMCVKKLRRHALADVRKYLWTDAEGEEKTVMLCRHCRDFAFKPQPPSTEAHP